ncbi:MAG: ANTAR domain-containing protein [Gaiellales bacterium]
MSKLEISTELLDSLQRLSSLLESEDALEESLSTVVNLSVVALPGCDAAGVTLRAEGRDTTAAASDEYTLEIDKIQYDSGEGPCVTAITEAKVQQIKAISQETRWPEFCRRAAERGVKSTLSFPLRSNGTVGALNLYAKTERAFTETSVEVGHIFANQATIALLNAHTYVAARQVAEQLNEALKTRDMIGQAKGILMEREGVSDDEAFDMLKTISQNSNVKLRDIARRLIDERTSTTD